MIVCFIVMSKTIFFEVHFKKFVVDTFKQGCPHVWKQNSHGFVLYFYTTDKVLCLAHFKHLFVQINVKKRIAGTLPRYTYNYDVIFKYLLKLTIETKSNGYVDGVLKEN